MYPVASSGRVPKRYPVRATGPCGRSVTRPEKDDGRRGLLPAPVRSDWIDPS